MRSGLVRQDLIAAALIAVVGIVTIMWVIPSQTSRMATFGMPPALMPTVTMGTVTALALLLAATSLFGSDASVEEDEDMRTLPQGMGILGFGLVFLCIVLINLTGLMIGGALTVASFMLLMGERRALLIAGAALAAPGIIQLLLGAVLRL